METPKSLAETAPFNAAGRTNESLSLIGFRNQNLWAILLVDICSVV